jgi:S-adenosylmethionine decarboxylase
MTLKRPPLGRHFILDVADAPFGILDDPVTIEEALVVTVQAMKAKVLGIHVHRLVPQGISGVVVISESHLTIHTWPELGEAAVDLFSCGDEDAARKAIEVLAPLLGAGKSEIREILRGIRD